MLITITPVPADLTTIPMGGDVFIGEQGLKIPVVSGTTLSWYTGVQTPGVSPPLATVTVLDANNFYVAPASFVGHAGNWYIGNTNTVAFVVNDPSLVVNVWDQQMQKMVTGKSAPAGDFLNFRLETNLATVPSQRSDSTGFVTIRVKKSDGTVYTELLQNLTTVIPLGGQSVNAMPYFWVKQASGPYGWSTGILDSQGNRIYKSGVYTFWIESNLNGMKTNYRDPSGNDFTGKTVSATQTVTLASDTVAIESSKDSVVRGNPFSVTVSGRPYSSYYLWITNTSAMSGKSGDQPPSIMQGQADVSIDPVAGPWPLGNYQFQGGNGKTIREDVPQYFGDQMVHGTAYYARVNTSASGTRTIGFITGHDAVEGLYTIRVERPDPYDPPASDGGINRVFRSDQVDIGIQKGAVTIVAAGDQNYSVGKSIKLIGTDSETDFVYLFITGPGLPSGGGMLMNPLNPVNQSDPSTFSPSEVLEDNTWSIIWPTGINLSAGMYTIYAAATPTDKNHLNNTEYGFVTINITTISTIPTITPTLTPTTVIPSSLPTTAPITIPTTTSIGGGWRTNLIPTQVTTKPTIAIPTTSPTNGPLTPTPTATSTIAPTPVPTRPSPWDITLPKIPLWSGTLPKISFTWIPV
jgi:trimeric autotransporter adhesin